jgi:hypothetical protein
MRSGRALWLLLATAAVLASDVDGAAVRRAAPSALRVERLLEGDALGIDTSHPLLSWSWGTPDGPSTAAGDRELPLVQLRGAESPSQVSVSFANTREELDTQPLWVYHGPGDDTPSMRYNGPKLRSQCRVHWRVCSGDSAGAVLDGTACATASFVTGIVVPTDWKAKWIRGRQLRSPEVDLTGRGAVTSAVVSVSGLGLVELRMNGAKVGDAVLDPGFSTNYTERILYSTWYATPNQQQQTPCAVVTAPVPVSTCCLQGCDAHAERRGEPGARRSCWRRQVQVSSTHATVHTPV